MSRMSASCRSNDPFTSYLAADLVEGSGRAKCARRLCYEAVLKKPGQTAGEIAKATGLERHIPSRRLPELRQAGFVINGTAKKCEVLGTMQMTWLPKPRDPQGKLFPVKKTKVKESLITMPCPAPEPDHYPDPYDPQDLPGD